MLRESEKASDQLIIVLFMRFLSILDMLGVGLFREH